MNSNLLKIAGTVAALTFLSGCANSGAADMMHSDLQKAMSMAEQANSAAAAAQVRADEAMSMASAANSTAAEAKGMAMATDERINRMFKSSMMK